MAGVDGHARAAPLGIACVAAFAAGVVLAMQSAALPPQWACAVVAVLGLAGWIALRRARWVGALAFGAAWACLHGAFALAVRLPADLVGQDIAVVGRIQGLPQASNGLARFDFVADGAGNPEGIAGRHLRLGWYRPRVAIASGDRWRLTVKLRRPRGVLDPGGFDFEKLALERRIAATGYVRDTLPASRLGATRGIDTVRASLSQRIADAVPDPGVRFVRALALGDTRGLSEDDWETLRATGLTHQIAISGFHVGIVASFGALLAWLLYRALPRLGLRWPRAQAQAAFALLAGFGYTALVGFELPTVRTLLMIAAALLARLLRRPAPVSASLALALATILLVDPLAVLAAGFWLSFAGVAWLVWCLPHDAQGGHVRQFFRAQWIATLGLLPLTVWFFGQASLVAPLTNLVGIPCFSLVIVPLSLVGLALDVVVPGIGAPVLRLAAHATDLLWVFLEHAAHWPWALVQLPEPTITGLALAVAGAFWLLLPRGVPGKPLALLLWLPLLWPRLPAIGAGVAEVAMIDVGQGLSLLVRTQHHALVYDAGPAYTGGLDLGEAAVVPALHALGVRRVDALVVSHGDNDHSGGADAVRRAFPVARRFAPEGWPKGGGYASCQRDVAWTWDGVSFRFLHPPPFFPYLRNDSGCVLRVSGRGWAALLPADIGSVVEERLVREQPAMLRADVLVAPHHGSATSSSDAFLDAVHPSLALVSIGQGNRFGLPKPAVIARYVERGITVEDSAHAGLVRVRLDARGAEVVERTRERRRRFWHEPAAPSARLAGEPTAR